MTLYEFLRILGADVRNTESKLGNLLDGDLAIQNKYIEFDQDIHSVSDDELYEIGRIILLEQNRGKAYFKDEIIDTMKGLIKKYQDKS